MKIAVILLAALLAVTGLSFGETVIEETYEEPVVSIMGTVNEMTQEGLLLDTEMGPVLVLIPEDVLLEGFESPESLEKGRAVEVMYNGMMTRSIPAQITAQKITSVQMTGAVTELMEGAFLMETQTHGPVVVHVAEGAQLPETGKDVTVTFNGVMTMSLPAQIGAWTVQ